jgi:dynein heavy chain, axonemal
MQGVLNISPLSCASDPMGTLARLWLHETMRVMHDRLITPEDQMFIKQELFGFLSKKFGCRDGYEEVFEGETPLLFANFARLGVPPAERAYQAVTGAASSQC